MSHTSCPSLLLRKLAHAVLILGFLMLGIAVSGCNAPDTAAGQILPETVDFNFHIKPILSDRCFTCHGPDENARKANLRLDTEEGAFAQREDSSSAIVPGDVERSVFMQRIGHADPDERMPPPESNLTLSEYEMALLRRWIEQGAEWKKHWAYISPEKSTPPEVSQPEQIVNPIDQFIQARLEREGLQPAPKASKEILIRRLAFDLTGLPPTLEQIDAFIADTSPEAYERVVDQFLALHTYGEKMASHWLDAARYADSHGYQDDMPRTMWPWRDWVIHAFNSNLPYDEFIRWQLAGDLIPQATAEQRLATGFNRNHMITQEGGVIDEEFLIAYAADRTETTATVFLGLTMQCARCHDHKYDPISQEDYFRMFSFFNNVDEKGRIGYEEQTPVPTLSLSFEEAQSQLAFISDLSEGEDFHAMVMGEREANPRTTHILQRGQYDLRLDAVAPGTPPAVLSFPDTLSADRLGFADWLVHPQHPLTARVAVNRLWQTIFGVGIVQTPEDFGNQGSLPSHPELLDWLAVTFVEDGWDVKAMLKLIVTSSTYQQSSVASEALLVRDPDNLLLARGSRYRLPAEMIRDQALAVSGLLVRDIGGPSVKPYQPDGLWAETTGGGGGPFARYVRDSGEKLYRRSLYTIWKRTVPPPSMMTLDAADRSLCSVQRQRTSTPLQALLLMNDPQMVEAARVLAYRVLEEGGTSQTERLTWAFRQTTGRYPSDKEREVLGNILDEQQAFYQQDREAATALLQVGEWPHDESYDPIESAAYTMLVSNLFNLHETVTKL